MTHFQTIAYALLGGVLPALLWLTFWLREDRRNPEPKRVIMKTFLLGMLSVILVLPFQKGVEAIFPSLTVLSLFLWAMLEEIFKFGAGYFGGLHSAEDNEPVDPMVYMITAALGFVALENTLFIFGPLIQHDTVQSFVTGNMRFIGASLLHVVSSGILGASLSLSFYKNWFSRITYATVGLVIAIAFHLYFNLMIINLGDRGTTISFVSVWIGVVVLLLTFEKVKRIAR
jgi:RsiW-degrading membrane proteinase PrsW (M82 family)